MEACGLMWEIILVIMAVASLATAYFRSKRFKRQDGKLKQFRESSAKMKIEAVVVCVNYSDFLCWTLPTNKQHFNKMVVVTTKEDKATQKLCEYWHVQCVQTNVCYEDGASFNKGKMINEGLKKLDGDGWVVHMDADIFLPPMFRHLLNEDEMHKDGIYHIDRMMCRSFIDWLTFYTQPQVSNEADIYVHPRPFPLGVRLAKKGYGGWLPIGFFQMWHQGTMKLSYPTEHTDAGRTDLLFTLKFPRRNRHMLPEIIGIHLETVLPGKSMGSNWQGRKTPMFGAEVLQPLSEDDLMELMLEVKESDTDSSK